MLRDRIVCGIQDEAIQRKLLSENSLTLAKKAGDLKVALVSDANFVQRKSMPNKTKVKRNPPSATSARAGVRCNRCEADNHRSQDWRFLRSTCNSCGKIGHIAKTDEDYQQYELFNLRCEIGEAPPAAKVTCSVEGQDMTFELDFGAPFSLIPLYVYKQNAAMTALQKANGLYVDKLLTTSEKEQLLKNSWKPEEVSHFHQRNLVFLKDGAIESAECTCPAGKHKCSHMATILMYDVKNVGPTDQACAWNNPKPAKEHKHLEEYFVPKQYVCLDRKPNEADKEWIIDSLKDHSHTGVHFLLSPEPSIYRKERLTSSNFSLALRTIRNGSVPPSTLKTLKGEYKIHNEKTEQWGVVHEATALQLYEEIMNVKVDMVGLLLHPSGKLGCSPDGVVGDMAIEIKCPETKIDKDILREIATGKWYVKYNTTHLYPKLFTHGDTNVYMFPNDDICLNVKHQQGHAYYHQV
ncbi:hypothetical protein JTE90_028733 [Oedothorax gibbosus]|uniref:SWIM-type domain-containing protein n=1 Tax=Oedothorax gibbosus TaxID=931172 RepID=A0AAV6UHY9_9ARAC|nr:hypothetical protein JTE90_028733 [Oedothorax gibbosus]